MSEERQLSDDQAVLPKWIFFFGCLLILIGGGAGLLGIFSPTTFFNDFPNFNGWSEIPYVTTGWGIRNVAMAGAMIIALWLKAPAAIGVVFAMRFITEAGDLLNTLATGHGSLGQSLVLVAVVWVIVFLIPEALGARWGLSRAFTSKR